ncbi:MAG: PHP domain-containing protein [Stomatobaculum sp.]|nr:PHP domain-containing protein [Stomatobaculum sp.]
MIDLHVHSTASDGSLTPRELVYYAAEKQLSAIALTDHDTVSGLAEAIAASHHAGIELIPGVEMSCVWEGTEIHILGYFVDTGSPALQDGLSWFRRMRDERNETILDNLAEDGILLTEEELRAGDPDTVITRAHFARLLMEKGYVRDRKEAFAGYLAYGGKYVPTKDELTPERVMQMFYDSRIWPSLTHPVQYHLDEDSLVQLIAELKAMGLRGIEAWHSSQSWQDTARLQTIARLSGLIPTGGSDFHGSSKPDVEIGTGRGNLKIQERVLDAIKEDYAQQF